MAYSHLCNYCPKDGSKLSACNWEGCFNIEHQQQVSHPLNLRQHLADKGCTNTAKELTNEIQQKCHLPRKPQNP